MLFMFSLKNPQVYKKKGKIDLSAKQELIDTQ